MRYLVGRYGVSTRRACGVVKATRSSAYYRSRKDPLHCRDMAVVIVPITQAEAHVQ